MMNKQRFKRTLISCIPPIVLYIINRLQKDKQIDDTPVSLEWWSGSYTSWEEANAQCSGYDSELILQKCKASLLKVKRGEAVYERDSILFDEIQYSWGLLAGLQRVALEHSGRLSVLDFGGSLGSTYFQNRQFLSTVSSFEWSIVEQSHFVDCGKENFENDELQFFYTIEECLKKRKPNVLILSSVLQYLEKPYDWINRFLDLDIPYIIVDRTAIVATQNDILTTQHVPTDIYEASYPAWFFKQDFFNEFAPEYDLISTFESRCTHPIHLNNQFPASWQGAILKNKA